MSYIVVCWLTSSDIFISFTLSSMIQQAIDNMQCRFSFPIVSPQRALGCLSVLGCCSSRAAPAQKHLTSALVDERRNSVIIPRWINLYFKQDSGYYRRTHYMFAQTVHSIIRHWPVYSLYSRRRPHYSEIIACVLYGVIPIFCDFISQFGQAVI